MEITHAAPQLVITYEYDQSQIDGPPFSIDANEMARLYGQSYALNVCETRAVEGGMKGKVAATETVWMLSRNVS